MKNILLSLFLLFCAALSAQQANNMILLGTWNDTSLPNPGNRRFSDVWGYAAAGREYALLASRGFVHVLDITNPASIQEIERLNTFSNSLSTWRDIKTYGHYAYCVTEESEGLQIIDLATLPDSANIIRVDTFDFFNCHNIFVDSLATPPKLYAFGTESAAERNGYLVYSLADPAQPQLLASTSLAGFGRYIHDGFVVRDTLFANHGFNGMFVYDVSAPATPVELGRLTSYPESGYNHSCWRTETTDYLVLCDETTDRGVKIIDVADPLDMEVQSVFRSTLLYTDGTGPTNSIAHNPYILGDSLVVLSYYGDGLQVWNIEDPTAPYRIGYYDTTPNSVSYGGGNWGAYPWLPSGNILASDMNNGLFVIALDQAGSLPVGYASWTARPEGKNVQLAWTTATEEDNAGFAVEHSLNGVDYQDLGFVAPSGLQQYAFTHAGVSAGVHYYRLRQIDLDGTETFSEVRRVTLNGGIEGLEIFPNPAPAGAILSLRGVGPTENWYLRDGRGRVVHAGRGARLNANLAPGIYVLDAANHAPVKVVVTR